MIHKTRSLMNPLEYACKQDLLDEGYLHCMAIITVALDTMYGSKLLQGDGSRRYKHCDGVCMARSCLRRVNGNNSTTTKMMHTTSSFHDRS